MTAQELGCRVNDDVCSVLYRTDEVWSTECVVDDEWYVVAMCNLSQRIDVGNVGVWVSEGLCVQSLGVWLYGSLHGLEIAHVNDGVCDALCRKGVCDEVERASV